MTLNILEGIYFHTHSYARQRATSIKIKHESFDTVNQLKN